MVSNDGAKNLLGNQLPLLDYSPAHSNRASIRAPFVNIYLYIYKTFRYKHLHVINEGKVS